MSCLGLNQILVSTARKGVEICKNEGIDFLLAVGGGSVIDCTKLIAAGAKYDGDAWDLVVKKAVVKEALPFGTVLTLAATGSEMNSGSVITNWETNEKYGWGSPVTFPKFSILDPVTYIFRSKGSNHLWNCRYDVPYVRALFSLGGKYIIPGSDV